jgi:hypothetical protein
MFVTSRYLCFYSNIFGSEKKIRIPFHHIKEISKRKTALVIPNALSIMTEKKEYIFRSFWERDECFQVLRFVISTYLGREPITPSPHTSLNMKTAHFLPIPLEINAEAGPTADLPAPPDSAKRWASISSIGDHDVQASEDVFRDVGLPVVEAEHANVDSAASGNSGRSSIDRDSLFASEDAFRDADSIAVELTEGFDVNKINATESMDTILDESNEPGRPPKCPLQYMLCCVSGYRLSSIGSFFSCPPDYFNGSLDALDDPNAEENYAEEADKARLELVFVSGTLPMTTRDFWYFYLEDEAPYTLIKYVYVREYGIESVYTHTYLYIHVWF